MQTDSEIRTIEDDLLEFKVLSETLKEIILSPTSPLTIGLYGEWGSGKTSLMQMTQSSLEDNKTVKTAWFNAWKFDKSLDLRLALIQTILREIQKDKNVNRTIRNKVKGLLKRVNWFGLGIATVNQLLLRPMTFKEATMNLFIPENTSQKTLELIGDFEEEFKGIVKEYVGDSKGKIVVFIDDLDRCTPDKAIDILESIKLFLNVKQSIFIIGADRKVIEMGIRQRYPEIFEDWGKKYLDKIIQITFVLPPLTKKTIIKDFIPELGISEDMEDYIDIIAAVGENPRTIKRLLNHFEIKKILAEKKELEGEVDPKIIAKLSVIELRQPEFHDTLVEMYVESKTNFVEILKDILESSEEEKEKKLKEWESLEKYLNDEKFMKFLFEKPSLENIELEPYVYLVGSTSNSEDKKIDHFSIGYSFSKKGNFIEAIKNYDKAIELNPSYASAWNNKGYALDKLGKYNEAIECYDKAIDLDPSYTSAWNNKGYVLDELGKYNEAIECYDRAIKLNPTNIDVWYNKGYVLNELGKYNEAIECYNKAIDLDPNNINARYNKGYVLNELGKYNEAIECYNKAIDLDPNYIMAWNKRGVALDNLGRYEEAIECYDKAIELNPNYVNTWNNKGVALDNLGKHEEAIKYYDKAIELDPNYVNAWYNKGYVLNKLEKYSEAIKYYDKAIELDSNYFKAWYNKGNALDKLGKYNEAIECYDMAIELDSNDADVWNNKGLVLDKLGKQEEAKKCYDKFKELINQTRKK